MGWKAGILGMLMLFFSPIFFCHKIIHNVIKLPARVCHFPRSFRLRFPKDCEFPKLQIAIPRILRNFTCLVPNDGRLY